MAALQVPAQWMIPYVFSLIPDDEHILREGCPDILFEENVTQDRNGKIYVVGKSDPSKETINQERIDSIRVNSSIHVNFNPTLTVFNTSFYLEVQDSRNPDSEMEELGESLKERAVITDKEASENVTCNTIEVSREFFESVYSSRFQCCGETQKKIRCKRHNHLPFVWCFQHEHQQSQFEKYASGEDMEVPKWWEEDCSSMVNKI